MSDEELEVVEEEVVEEVASVVEPEPDTAEDELPAVRDLVLYHTEQRSYPAIVTSVYPTGFVDVVVFGSPLGSAQWRQTVRHGEPGQKNTWSR